MIGQTHTEKISEWKCPFCHLPNPAWRAGADECFFCKAYVETAFTGYENEIVVKFAQRAKTHPHWMKFP